MTEIDVTPDELEALVTRVRPSVAGGLFWWLKQNFNLDLFPKGAPKNDSK